MLLYVDNNYRRDTTKKWSPHDNVNLVKPLVNVYSVSEVWVLVLESKPLLWGYGIDRSWHDN